MMKIAVSTVSRAYALHNCSQNLLDVTTELEKQNAHLLGQNPFKTIYDKKL